MRIVIIGGKDMHPNILSTFTQRIIATEIDCRCLIVKCDSPHNYIKGHPIDIDKHG